MRNLHFVVLFPGLVWAQAPVPEAPAAVQTPAAVITHSARLVGPYDQTQKLRVTFGLKPPKVEEERRLIEEIYREGSPQFHKFLTAKEWNDRFAPSAADEEAVVHWATSQGLRVTRRFPNRLVVDTEAPVAQIQRVLGVNINRYQWNGATVFSNDRDPVIPAQLAGIVGSVAGLNSMEVMLPHAGATEPAHPDYSEGPTVSPAGHIQAHGDRAGLAKAMADRGQGLHPNLTNGFFDPFDIYSSNAYNFGGLNNLEHCCNPLHVPGGTPPETSIAIATAGAQQLSDMQGFQKQFPQLAFNITYFNINGTPACCDEEGTMDAEWSTAMANSFGSTDDTAHVYVYQGANNLLSTFTVIYEQMLTDNLARVMSTSWSATEIARASDALMKTQDNIFRAMTAQGWTLVASSGDRGSVDDCEHVLVAFPASSPNVIAAGGTNLTLRDGKYASEAAWTGDSTPGSCKVNAGGGGGGRSNEFAVPFYQAYLGFGTRVTPDISLNAFFPQTTYFNGRLSLGGGTSVVAPELAGFFAQENAYLLFLKTFIGDRCFGSHPCAPIGNANYYMYIEDQKQPYAPHYPFYDITTGCASNDANTPSAPFYCAGPRYDMATGLGSANMLQLAWAINYSAAGDFGPPEGRFLGADPNKWYNTPQTIIASFVDTTLSPRPATGVAGISLAWDKDPAPESFSKPTPGDGDAFYTGPQFANTDRAVLLLGNAGQGCHTANARAWDNTGTSSGLLSFGPICFDTVAPKTSMALSAGATTTGWNTKPVSFSLTSSDPAPGSGLAGQFYSVDNASCTPDATQFCGTYAGPVTVSASGAHTVYFFSRDAAGNSSGRQQVQVKIDTAAPNTTSALSGPKSGTNFTGPVSVALNAGDGASGVARTVYQVDGGPVTTYGGAFPVNPDGQHTIAYHSVDRAGNQEPSRSVSFTIKRLVATTSTVAQSGGATVFDQPVTFTATVKASAGTATGSVAFFDGANSMGTATLNSGKASFTLKTLTLGNHSITAKYTGAAGFSGSTSAAIAHGVSKAGTSVALASSKNPSTAGQNLTFTATITPAFPGVIPGGNIVFTSDGATLGTVGLTNGKASLSTSALGKGRHTIKATYTGGARFLGSAGSLPQTVN